MLEIQLNIRQMFSLFSRHNQKYFILENILGWTIKSGCVIKVPLISEAILLAYVKITRGLEGKGILFTGSEKLLIAKNWKQALLFLSLFGCLRPMSGMCWSHSVKVWVVSWVSVPLDLSCPWVIVSRVAHRHSSRAIFRFLFESKSFWNSGQGPVKSSPRSGETYRRNSESWPESIQVRSFLG